MVRRSVRQALEPIGWKVTEAENDRIAVKALAATRPDVIDPMISKMDGFEFLDKLRLRPDSRPPQWGGVERIIQKSDRDEMLRRLSREISKCVKRQTGGA